MKGILRDLYFKGSAYDLRDFNMDGIVYVYNIDKTRLLRLESPRGKVLVDFTKEELRKQWKEK